MRTSTWLACTLASGLATASVMIPPALLSSREVSPDNTCGNSGAGDNNGYTCPESLPCCSKNGWCGETTAYCGTGCQSGFGTCGTTGGGEVSPDNSCGNTGAGDNNGYTCPETLPCCSQNGWCGSTTDYCGTGCQSAFGTCNSGSNPERCGPDFNNQKCGSSQCCSEAGYCGTTADHCMAPGCQTQFGPACDANTVPEGTNTSSIARPKLGNVVIGGAGLYVCNKPGTVALTYDDGPYDYTGHLLNLLNQYGAKATFFITGINNGKGAIDDETTNWPKIIRRMHNNGHHIASHTWSHADLSTLSSAARKNEMYKNEMALRNILGFIPTYMRPPYSSCTSASGCPKDLKDLGYHIIYFDLDTSDYLNTTPQTIQKSKDKFDDFFVGKDSGVDDGLAIAHDIHWQTVNNLTEYMLQGLQDRGYRAVTLGECLNDPKANWYREV